MSNNWIPCSERQPENDGWYIVSVVNALDGTEAVEKALFKKTQGIKKGWFRQGVNNRVIAWQPLPDPYRATS